MDIKEKVVLFLRHLTAIQVRTPIHEIDARTSFYDMGLRSSGAVQMVKEIERRVGDALSPTLLFDHPAVDPLADWLTERYAARWDGLIVRKTSGGEAAAGEGRACEPRVLTPFKRTSRFVALPDDAAATRGAPSTPSLESPLSEARKGLWVMQKMAPGMSAYNVPLCYRILGSLDRALFEKAISLLLERSPILTSVIEERGGEPVQVVRPGLSLPLPVEDVSGMASPEIVPHIRERAREPFDLERGPLLRVHLFSRSEREEFLLFTIHHIVFDGGSLRPFVQTVFGAYRDLVRGKEPTVAPLLEDGREFVHRERTMLSGAEGERRLAYWRERLAGETPTLQPPADGPRSLARPFEGRTHVQAVPPGLGERVRRFARSNSVYLSTLFLGVFKLLLHRCTGERDVIVGLTANQRTEKRHDDLIGCFIDMIPIRSRLDEEESFGSFMERLQSNLLNGFANACPFPALVRELNIPAGADAPPVFQVFFIFQDTVHLSDARPPDGMEPPMEPVNGLHQEGGYEMGLEVFDEGDAFTLHFKCNPDLYASDTVSRMVAHYLKLLEGVVQRPDRPLARYSMLSEAEKRTLLIDWNRTEQEYPRDRCVHELIEQQANRTPDAVAVVFEDREMTFRELDERTTILGKHLQKQGVGPDALVGVCVERSLDMIVGLLGVLKAGGAYVPLDPGFPSDRLAYMVENSRVSLVLTQGGLLDKASSLLGKGGRAIMLDRDWSEIETEAGTVEFLERRVRPNHLVYVIYTSGSTGKPKGVMISHRALANFLVSMGREPGLDANDSLLAVTTYSFDIAWLELYLPLIQGARCHICSAGKARNPERLKAEIRRVRPTIIQATPVTFTMLFHVGWENREKCKVLVGGEALTEKLKQQFTDAGCETWNMFGPTETTVWSTVREVKADESITIGEPIANTQIYIVDARLAPTPIGVQGELCIAGDGLARGYMNRPDLTAKVFVDNPFRPGTRLYRTGDLARWLPDGRIEFIGRVDHQVKIRGHRIELGEIETCMRTLPGIQECVATVKEIDENKQIVAWCVPKTPDSAPLDPREARSRLKETLPAYMIPSIYISLDRMPLTPNGKINRKDLMAREVHREVRSERPRETSPGRSVIEKTIMEIWRETLNLDEIDGDDLFFEVGGNSFLALTAAEKIKERLRCDFSVTDLFQHPTINGVSAHVAGAGGREPGARTRRDETGGRGAGAAPPASPRPRRSDPPGEKDAEPVAVVGMSCRFPRAGDPREFWENLVRDRDCIREIPGDRWDWKAVRDDSEPGENRSAIQWGGFMEGVDLFDAPFFGLSPMEAELMDPQQRIFLEIAWKAIEEAGYRPSDLSGTKTGVFVGVSSSDYLELMHKSDLHARAHAAAGSAHSIVANRLSFFLNLRGPSQPVDTACSSSLTAIHRAVSAIQAGGCDMAIAGGVHLMLSPTPHLALDDAGMLSRDGRCKTFDKAADGFVRGEGAGAFLLKPLRRAEADGDHIHGVILGTAENHGGRTHFLTTPNEEALAELVVDALESAGVDPRTVTYMEAHGSGSPLGDPIEFSALKKAFNTMTDDDARPVPPPPWCGLGSVKTNIGNLEAAAGTAGVIKVLLAMAHRALPASLHFKEPSPHIQLDDAPFYVVLQNRPWRRPEARRSQLLWLRRRQRPRGAGGIHR